MAHLLSRMSSRRTEVHTSAAHRAFWVVTGEAGHICTNNNTAIRLTVFIHSSDKKQNAYQCIISGLSISLLRMYVLYNVCI